MGGMVCTSSNAYKIIEKGLQSGKKKKKKNLFCTW